jgi:hypothetical protein
LDPYDKKGNHEGKTEGGDMDDVAATISRDLAGSIVLA